MRKMPKVVKKGGGQEEENRILVLVSSYIEECRRNNYTFKVMYVPEEFLEFTTKDARTLIGSYLQRDFRLDADDVKLRKLVLAFILYPTKLHPVDGRTYFRQHFNLDDAQKGTKIIDMLSLKQFTNDDIRLYYKGLYSFIKQKGHDEFIDQDDMIFLGPTTISDVGRNALGLIAQKVRVESATHFTDLRFVSKDFKNAVEANPTIKRQVREEVLPPPSINFEIEFGGCRDSWDFIKACYWGDVGVVEKLGRGRQMNENFANGDWVKGCGVKCFRMAAVNFNLLSLRPYFAVRDYLPKFQNIMRYLLDNVSWQHASLDAVCDDVIWPATLSVEHDCDFLFHMYEIIIGCFVKNITSDQVVKQNVEKIMTLLFRSHDRARIMCDLVGKTDPRVPPKSALIDMLVSPEYDFALVGYSFVTALRSQTVTVNATNFKDFAIAACMNGRRSREYLMMLFVLFDGKDGLNGQIALDAQLLKAVLSLSIAGIVMNQRATTKLGGRDSFDSHFFDAIKVIADHNASIGQDSTFTEEMKEKIPPEYHEKFMESVSGAKHGGGSKRNGKAKTAKAKPKTAKAKPKTAKAKPKTAKAAKAEPMTAKPKTSKKARS